jgi:hypothetical protein
MHPHCFTIIDFTFISVIYNNIIVMNGAQFFIHPRFEWQRRYEALRTSFIGTAFRPVVR